MDFEVDLIEYISDGVMVLDEQHVVLNVNSALEKLLDLPAKQIIGKKCEEIINLHPSIKSREDSDLCNYLQNLKVGMKDEYVTIFTHNGLRREVKASYADFHRGFFFLILNDVGAKKLLERLQTEFIATASHQLRTPLASIKTSISLLLDNTEPQFHPLLRRLLENINISTLRLERVVNDLIELTNLLGGRVQLTPRLMEVHDLINQAVKLSQIWLERRNQTLHLEVQDAQLYVEADSSRISQVLSHLLSNASKFSKNGSTIKLTVSLSKEENGHNLVVFSVQDQGIGIAPEQKDFIFEKFYQVQVIENSEEVGSGLGLPLAKALVELSGGHIWFESELGQGSIFNFSLPAI